MAGANNNSTPLTLTCNNLDDSLTYDLVGAITRAAGTNNLREFRANWTAGGTTIQSNALTDASCVSFTRLNSTDGPLVVLVDGTNANTIVSQLELTAVAVISGHHQQPFSALVDFPLSCVITSNYLKL